MKRGLGAETDAAYDAVCGAGNLIDNLARAALEAEAGDDVVFGIEAALDVKRLPRIFFFEFCKTTGVLGARAKTRALHFARTSAPDVSDNQFDCASDCRVGSIALTEDVGAHVHRQAMTNRAVYHDDRSRAVGGSGNAVDVEFLRADCLNRCYDDGQIIRF